MNNTLETAVATEAPSAPQLPGLEVLGRGVNLRPGLPYELKQLLFSHKGEKVFFSSDLNRHFSVPGNYAVNPSPPMSAKGALGQTQVVESWDQVKEMLSIDAKATVSSAPFSVDMSLQQLQSNQTSKQYRYALRTSFIPLWEAYIPDIFDSEIESVANDFPVPFDRSQREKYRLFFDRYGTHVVKRVWVGGKANLMLSISKDSGISQNEIRAGVSVASAGASGAVQEEQKRSKEFLLSNSDITVSGEGGNKLKLGALRSLDDGSFEDWLHTIGSNPKVIEMELVGIWSLIQDQEKALALSKAYKNSIQFRSISMLSNFGEKTLLTYGNRGILWNRSNNDVEKSGDISELIPGLPPMFCSVDGILDYGHVYGDTPDQDTKFYIFSDRLFARYDKVTHTTDPGYPQLIKGFAANGDPYWPGMTFERVDDVINWGDGYAYFFSGSQYIRYDLMNHRADPGYPKSIHPNWEGLSFEYIDAVVTWDYQKAYFFKGNEYIRFDMLRYQADPGYPKTLVSGYIEDWQLD